MKNRIVLVTLLMTVIISLKAQTNENAFSMKLGDGKFSLLTEGQRNGNLNIVVGVTPEIAAKYAPDKSFPMATNAFLWQIDGKNILFDTGYGRALFDNLQSLGVNPENIDAIFITHAHGDHIGGLLRNDQAAFPKATLYFPKAEYDYWTNDEVMKQMPENARNGFLLTKKVCEAYKDRLQLFEPNPVNPPYNKTVYPGIKAIAAYGHTPGHTVFLLKSKKDKLLVWGDLTHAMAIQMPHPEIAMTYDSDPKEAVQSREVILKFVSEQAIPVAGMHIPFPGIGTVEKSDSEGYRFVPAK